MSSPKESHRFAVLGILALDQLNKESKQTDGDTEIQKPKKWNRNIDLFHSEPVIGFESE